MTLGQTGRKVGVVVLVAGAAMLVSAIGADAKSDNLIFPSTTSGPPGTLVTLPDGPIECASSPHLVLYLNSPGQPPADLTEGVPFDARSDLVVIPRAAPGEYQVILVCDTSVAAYFFFTVEDGEVIAQPNLAG
jgi:hypothetical protein